MTMKKIFQFDAEESETLENAAAILNRAYRMCQAENEEDSDMGNAIFNALDALFTLAKVEEKE